MSDILAHQEALLHSLSRALDNFKKLGRNNYTPAKIRSRMTTLKDTWTQCIQGHAALQQVVPEANRESLEYFRENKLDDHEDVYQTTLDYMADCLEDLEPCVSQNHTFETKMSNWSARGESSSFSLNHLPPIQLPPFSGQFEEWESFRDRFKSLIIDNQDLSDFSRMHFLTSSLTGRARDVIAGMPVTADNFSVAWSALTRRYENKRRLIELHVATLYNIPTVSRECASELHALRDTAEKAIAALNRLDRSSSDILSDILVYFVSQKLDPATRRAWKLRFGDDSPPPTYDDLSRFLSSRAIALEELSPPSAGKSNRNTKVTSASATTASEPTCELCKKRHFLNKCPSFVEKSTSQRRELVKQFKRCFNCLSTKHSASNCKSKFTCRLCQQKHHSMLHLDSPSSSTARNATTTNASVISEPTSNSAESPPVVALSSVSLTTAPTPVLLATARVIVSSPTGRALNVRALLDQGSEVTFITENLAQHLRLRRSRTLTSISAVGCVDAGVCRHAATITIAPRDRSGPTFSALAFILASLTKYSPGRASIDTTWKHLTDLRLADDDPTRSDPIDLIIGADVYGRVILEGIRKGPVGQPIAQNTHLGWVISGPISSTRTPSRQISVLHCSLEQELRKFWETEELPTPSILSPDDKRCEEHFLATHSRAPDGRYIVRLPFRDGPPIQIGDSRAVASRMLATLNRRLSSKPELKQEYDAFMAEYEQLGHMERVSPAEESNSQLVYIPHHSVVRASSATTRVRVVFNASSGTTNGTSLNDHLLVGPQLQTDLCAVLLRWRRHKYVYAADIAKMYRQILVDPRDRDYQRILWNADAISSEQEYQLLTVTYGMASAPFLALRVVKQLIQDEGHFFPLASSILREDIYVDDVLFGAEDMSLLRQTRDQVCALLERGGFDLRKWASNKTDLLTDIPSDNHGLACNKDLGLDERLSVLGIVWNPALDFFQFNVALPDSIPRTKRAILSTIARLFDPLGWVTPTTIAAKIFMQQLWRLKLDWDDEIPAQALARWTTMYKTLPDLSEVQLPRWTGQGSDTVNCELHGFADASTSAFAAVVYLRVTSLSGNVTTALLIGKSKVAPIKPMSVPRLELSAAVLLSRLVTFVRSSLGLLNMPCHCWTDSTVTLAWLNQHPSRWKTFVAHRVEAVRARIPDAQWHHVPTADNPADCASRGLLSGALAVHTLWWQGPAWLRLDQSEWPALLPSEPNEAHFEARPTHTHIAQSGDSWDLASRYSTWLKLVRVTAFIMRFIERSRKEKKFTDDSTRRQLHPLALSVEECQRARTFWLKTIQAERFPDELRRLQRKQPLSSKNAVLSLNPFLDGDGLIRVGGRLENAPLPYRTKHPVLLSVHPIVGMIVRHVHVKALHAGAQLTLATLRQDFWLLRARNLVKSVIHSCVVCARERAKVPIQLMGQLPSPRVTASTRAFMHCGVDYAGPVVTRASAGRGIKSHKAYIAVFICLATKAVHLELVGNYTTSAFLDAYTRFCARRGLPAVMYSDNGTTFTGADKELARAYREALRDPDFLNRTASDSVAWKFIPPHAPHFGGLWEAGVKSLKHHLRRVLGAHTLTFEELTTILCKIEACLNSRPLGPLTASIDDYEPLTPGHFLIGSALNVSPEPSVFDINEHRLSRWQLVRQITERFWRIWQSDYVNAMQQRVKWRQIMPSVKDGMMVLIRNPLLPPCKWELGRVTRCHAGADGSVRVVSVRTANSEYKRPIAQLCLLPVDIEPPVHSDAASSGNLIVTASVEHPLVQRDAADRSMCGT